MTVPRTRPIAALILCALTACTLAIVFGAIAALTYRADYHPVAGLTLQHLRPLHTTMGVAWIYLGGAAVVYFYLLSGPAPVPRLFLLRLKAQLLLWGAAGLGILVSLWMGRFSGREYMGAHWHWSIPIYLGWILFAWNYFSVQRWSLRDKPVYVYMWHTAMLLFLFSFAEGHAWLLERVGAVTLRDIALQWKSYGPLVGSFNLLVYGSLSFLACRIAGSDRSARSPAAFALLFLGLLNSFTNFGHHTYHLPQSHLVKWISCIVSLSEAVLVVRYLLNVLGCLRSRAGEDGLPGVRLLLAFASIWSFLHVGAAVLISVPPLNTFIHGTHFVMGHAMGSMLGIDSTILWAVLLYVLHQFAPAGRPFMSRRAAAWTFGWINLTMFCLIALLMGKGTIDGYLRYLGPLAPAPPAALMWFPHLLITFGTALGAGILWVNFTWTFALVRPRRPASVADRFAENGVRPHFPVHLHTIALFPEENRTE